MLKPLKFKHSGDKIFAVGCTHVRHTPGWRPTLYEQRGFSTIEEHDEWLMGELRKLPHDAILFILGDFCLSTDAETAERLLTSIPCKVFYIEGNHESQVSKFYRKRLVEQFGEQFQKLDVYPFVYKNVTFLGDYAEVYVNGQHIVLSHFPFAIWNKSHKSSWNLHSHCHGSFKESLPTHPIAKRLDVGIDVFKRPISFREIQKIMAHKETEFLDHHNPRTN